MLSKSSIRKLKGELKRLGVTWKEQALAANTNEVMLNKIYNGNKYERAIIQALIDLRDEKKREAKALAAAI